MKQNLDAHDPQGPIPMPSSSQITLFGLLDGIAERREKNVEKINEQISRAKILGPTGDGTRLVLEILPGDDCPELRDEIYRLVEKSFDSIGAGTGKGKKTDKYNDHFSQLIVVKPNPDGTYDLDGGYRTWLIEKPIKSPMGQNIKSPMGDFFHFSEDTIKHFIENKYIELGTARANKEVLLSRNTLSHLRDGIAYLCDKYQSGGFIGKMTISALYDEVAAAFALFYLEKFFSSKSLGEAPYPKKEVEYLWREGRSDEIMTLFNTCMTHFTGDFSGHDRRQVRDIIKLFSNAPRFPDMFPFYFDKLETLDYIGTIQNGKVREAGIVVDKSKVKKDQAEKHFANVEKWKAEAEGAQLTVAEYVEKYPIAA